MIFRRAVVAGMFALLAAAASATAARADQAYAVEGHDVFRDGSRDVRSETVYHGVQRLSVTHNGQTTIYNANVEYERTGEGGRQHQRASFSSTLLPSGEQRDGPGNDPDYLTVLNQPFAVQLDSATMRDLAHVRRAVPFDFPSPMTGATLHGSLRRLPDAMVGTRRAMGISFEAKGPLHGALPDRPAMQLAGTITMKGTAYYAYGSALLLALDATLAIDGAVDDTERHAPVTIVYTRSIHSAEGRQAARIVPVPSRT